MLSHWFYYESLRYLIDHDILTGIAVLHEIAVANNTEHEQLYLGNEFVINKIRLNKYSYRILFSLRSVRSLSFGFLIVMFGLGFLSQAPLYILSEQLDGKTISITVSIASLLGTIPACTTPLTQMSTPISRRESGQPRSVAGSSSCSFSPSPSSATTLLTSLWPPRPSSF